MEGKKRSLLLIIFLFSLASSVSGVYLPLFYLSRGLAIPQIILLLCLTFVVLGTVPLFFTGKNTLSLGLLFFSVFCLLARSAHPALVGISYGLALAFFWPACNYLSLKVTGSDDRASFLGFLSAIRTATPIFGVALGGVLAASLGLGALLIISSVLYLISFVLASISLSGLPSEKFDRKEIRASFADRNFLLFLGSYLVQGFADSTWLVYPLFLARLALGKTSEMGFASAAVTLIGALMFVIIGRISDRFSSRRPFLLLAVPFEVVWFFLASIATSVQQLVIFSIASAISSALMRTGDALYADSYEKKHHAFMISLRETMLNAGRLISIIVLSRLIIAGDYSIYYLIFSGSAMLYLLIYLGIRERHNYG
jgi:MFS family permease